MNRQRSSTARLAATALIVGLVGLAGTACGRHGLPAASAAPTTSQAAQTSGTGPTISVAPTASAPASTIAVAWPSMVAAASKAPSAAAIPDPLDAEFKGLDQIVNDVNGSISGTDASSRGGE